MLEALKYNLNGQSASNFLKNIKRDLLADELDIETLQRLINLLIFSIHRDQARAERALQAARTEDASYHTSTSSGIAARSAPRRCSVTS